MTKDESGGAEKRNVLMTLGYALAYLLSEADIHTRTVVDIRVETKRDKAMLVDTVRQQLSPHLVMLTDDQSLDRMDGFQMCGVTYRIKIRQGYAD